MVDNGLLRKDERAQVLAMLRGRCGVNLNAVDASGAERGFRRFRC